MIKHITRSLTVGAALAAGLLLSDPAQAQQDGRQGGARQEQQDRRGGPGQGLDRRLEMLTERLSLSADQAAQIRRILEQQQAEMQRLRPARDGARGEGRPEGQARPEGGRRQPPAELVRLRERTEQQIEAVLNESQRTQYRELRQQMEQRRGERGERGGKQGETREGRTQTERR